ncbi:MAG: NlpC/P60 family protein [Bacteroidota bacterium]
MKQINLMKNFLLALLVVTIFISCSASSNAQRYKKDKEKKNSSIDSVTKSTDRSQRIVFEDPADSTGLDEEFDEVPVEETPVDESKIIANIEKLKSFNVALTPREKVLFEVIKFLDTPYKYGGNTRKGMDCSAFTLQVFKNSLDVDLPRSTSQQFKLGTKIEKEELKFGDLVFFNTRRKSFPGHVGIYLGENQFVHASRSLGVTVSSLDAAYYKKRYVEARRIENIENE